MLPGYKSQPGGTLPAVVQDLLLPIAATAAVAVNRSRPILQDFAEVALGVSGLDSSRRGKIAGVEAAKTCNIAQGFA